MEGLEKIHEIKGRKFLFKVETSDNPRDYLKYEELRNEIWGEPNDNFPGMRNMMCENFFNEGSCLFIGVYAEDEEGAVKDNLEHLVGFSHGYVGVRDNEIGFRVLDDNILFYSQYTGVREDFRHFGLGVLIKEFQKEKIMGIFGIYTVTCSYDPLTGINAYRDIHHFGMNVIEYREAHYLDFAGLLNREDIPCDRFLISWDLRKEIQRPEYDLESMINSGHMAIRAGTREVKGRSGSAKLEVVKELNLDLNYEFLLVEIPFDFYRMLRETDVPESKVRRIPIEWRMKTRQAFKTLFERKYKIIDFRWIEKNKRKRDFYVLKR